MPSVGKWRKYSPEFREKALRRMEAGENVSALAHELKIKRKLLYEWKTAKRQAALSTSVEKPTEEAIEIAKLRQQVHDLEQLAGQQAAELDFFAAALRSIEDARRKNDPNTGDGSTKQSKHQLPRKAKPVSTGCAS